MTELGEPKSSVTARGAAGSGRHSLPSTTNAYWCWPDRSDTLADQTPPAASARSGVRLGSQSLKSPTTATLDAWGATRTNCTISLPGSAGTAAPTATAPFIGDGKLGRSDTAPTTSNAATPAAQANPVSGDTRSGRGSVHHRSARRQRPGVARRTAAMTRASNPGSSAT